MKYLVIDNFFSDFEAERAAALSAQPQTIEHDGHSYPGMTVVKDPVSLEKIRLALDCDQYVQETVTYRQYLAKDEQQTFIHNDSNIATISAVAFLNTAEQCEGSGLAFWRHRETMWDGQPTLAQLGEYKDTPKLWHRIVKEGLDPSKWSITDFVPMKPNRCVIFQSHLYHSRYPKESIGADSASCRLIKTFFYKI